MFVLIGQNLHGTVTDVNQIDQHFNLFAASHHIVTKRPERFLFIVACFNIPAKRIWQQWNVFHTVTSGLVQWCFFLPGTENLQIFRENGTEKQSFCTMFFLIIPVLSEPPVRTLSTGIITLHESQINIIHIVWK